MTGEQKIENCFMPGCGGITGIQHNGLEYAVYCECGYESRRFAKKPQAIAAHNEIAWKVRRFDERRKRSTVADIIRDHLDELASPRPAVEHFKERLDHTDKNWDAFLARLASSSRTIGGEMQVLEDKASGAAQAE